MKQVNCDQVRGSIPDEDSYFSLKSQGLEWVEYYFHSTRFPS
jgi:hypothetical protein